MTGPSSVHERHLARETARHSLEQHNHETALSQYLDLFDGDEKEIAASIGYLYGLRDTAQYDIHKSIAYYQIAARQGDIYSIRSIGATWLELGEQTLALEAFLEGAKLGDAECAYTAFLLLKKAGSDNEAKLYSKLGAELDHPMALRDHAIATSWVSLD